MGTRPFTRRQIRRHRPAEVRRAVRSAEDRWNLKQELAAPSRYYGDGGTIHSTGQLDVGVNQQGRVVAVWFRCQLLPFKQYDADDGRGVGRDNPDIQLTGVEVLDG